MRRTRQPEIIFGRVAANGQILDGDGRFAIQRTGTGQYIITFERGFRFASATGSAFQSGMTVTFSAPTENTVNVTTVTTTTGTVTDATWAFDAKGYQQ